MKFSIAKFAKSKYFVPGIVIGLVVFGWLVLLIAKLGPFGEEKEEFVSQPTTWSQKEDYVIKETPEGKFVINEKAGLSFKVPKGWRVEMDREEKKANSAGGYWIDLFGLDGKLNEDGLLEKGCGMGIYVEFQKSNVDLVKQEIEFIKDAPEKYITENSKKEVIEISGYPSTKWVVKPKNLEMFKNIEGLKQIEEWVKIEIPVSNEQIIYVDTYFLSDYQEKCLQEFNNFLKTVSIK